MAERTTAHLTKHPRQHLTPVEELRSAAVLLRDAAKNATKGPWKAAPVWSSRSHATSAVYSNAHRAGSADSEVVASGLVKKQHGGITNPHNAVWIALVDPRLAEPLAAWLESVADEAERHEAQGWGNDSGEITDGHPITIARVLLGRDGGEVR